MFLGVMTVECDYLQGFTALWLATEGRWGGENGVSAAVRYCVASSVKRTVVVGCFGRRTCMGMVSRGGNTPKLDASREHTYCIARVKLRR